MGLQLHISVIISASNHAHFSVFLLKLDCTHFVREINITWFYYIAKNTLVIHDQVEGTTYIDFLTQWALVSHLFSVIKPYVLLFKVFLLANNSIE